MEGAGSKGLNPKGVRKGVGGPCPGGSGPSDNTESPSSSPKTQKRVSSPNMGVFGVEPHCLTMWTLTYQSIE